MTSWVYVFSKFTPEALLLEALFICVLTAGYTGFWILRKRKLGAADAVVPASLVKAYLGDLIGDAAGLRANLFGLVGAAEGQEPRAFPLGHAQPAAAAAPGGTDDARVAAAEAKLAEQSRAFEKILAEKAKLEKDLSEAAKRGSSVPAGAGATAAGGAIPSGPSAADLQKLQDKIQSLEARLAEYSVIEDDLANLKRLQQENSQLKSQLSGQSVAPTSTPAQAAPPAPAPTPVAPVAEDPAPAPVTAAPTLEPAVEAAPAATPAADPNFEGLVDEVEKSLQKPAGEPVLSQPTPPAPAAEKSDEDLIAEFEKMLNS